MSNLFNTGIIPAINDYLIAKAKEERNYGEYWSASSAGYCMRLNIMRRLGVPKVPELEDNATQTRIFEAGHIFHEWLQRITKDAGLSIASEVELQDEELMIRGHFDDLVLVDCLKCGGTGLLNTSPPPLKTGRACFECHTGKKLILYDYKTAHSASFNYKKRQTEIGYYHKMQLGTYMYMLRNNCHDLEVEGKHRVQINNVYLDTVAEARILSISKDDLRMHEQQLLWSPQLEKEVVGYWRTLNGYWAKKTMPKCTCLDFDGGFMGKKSAKNKFYNDFFYNDTPCSMEWFELCKKEGRIRAKE